MVRKHTATGVALVTIAGLALTACSAGGSTDGASTPAVSTDTINTELFYAPTNYNPATASGSSDVSVARLGFDTLLRQGETEGYIGGLATEWEAVSASQYVFSIRDDATCADTTLITPQIIADSLSYLVGNDDSASATWKSQAFGTGTPTFTADDAAGTLTIDLSEPYSQVLAGVTLAGTGVICPAGLADLDGLSAGTVDGAWSGPYMLESSSAGVSATYALRDDYDAWPAWENVEGVPAQTINMTVSADPNTSANLLESGGIDVTRFYDSNAERFTESDDYSYVTTPSSAYSLVFNQAPGSGSVFADNPELRAAVAQAVDTEGFNQAGLDGLGKPLTSVASSSFACVLDDPKLLQPYDVAAATDVLTGVTIRLLTFTNWDPAVEYLAESIRAAGATVDVTSIDASEWTAQLRNEPTTWDLTLAADTNSTGLVSLSIARNLGASYADGGVNLSGSDNPEGTAFLAAAMATTDADEQCDNLLAAQETILERVDMSPLITDTHFLVARAGYATYEFSGYWDISAMRIVS